MTNEKILYFDCFYGIVWACVNSRGAEECMSYEK